MANGKQVYSRQENMSTPATEYVERRAMLERGEYFEKTDLTGKAGLEKYYDKKIALVEWYYRLRSREARYPTGDETGPPSNIPPGFSDMTDLSNEVVKIYQSLKPEIDFSCDESLLRWCWLNYSDEYFRNDRERVDDMLGGLIEAIKGLKARKIHQLEERTFRTGQEAAPWWKKVGRYFVRNHKWLIAAIIVPIVTPIIVLFVTKKLGN